MTDNLALPDAPSGSIINIRDKYEVRFWARHLGVSRQRLLEAALRVGNSAAAIRKELGINDN